MAFGDFFASLPVLRRVSDRISEVNEKCQEKSRKGLISLNAKKDNGGLSGWCSTLTGPEFGSANATSTGQRAHRAPNEVEYG